MDTSTGSAELPLLTGLGYVAVTSDRLDDWQSFGCDFMGMQTGERTRNSLALRMDERSQRLVIRDSGDTQATYGWETSNAATLDALARRLDEHAVRYQELGRTACAERHVAGGLTLTDPDGHRLEVVHGAEIDDREFRPSRPITGFRTGSLGMGHAVLMSDRPAVMREFYGNVLGFRPSDYTRDPFEAYFYHLNPRHHSLAIVTGQQKGIHHLMVELDNLDDVGQGYDIAQRRSEGIGVTLGRHSNDHMTSFYARTPAGFMLEYGWGGLTLNPHTWVAHELHEGPSLWGHDRDWLPEPLRQRAVEMRMQAAADGLRAPVHVHGTNYELNDNVSRWERYLSTSDPSTMKENAHDNAPAH